MALLDGKVALITGGSRGIGLATARALCAEGARLALVARDADQLARAVEELGEGALALPADIVDPDAVRGAFARLRERFGRLDILVNNAAIGRLHRVEDASDDDLRAGVGANLLGVLFCVREAVPLLRTSGAGHIVNISSEAVDQPFPYLSVYVATKGAVEALSRALRRELRPDGIRVSLLRVGASASGGLSREWKPEVAAQALATWREQGLLNFAKGAPMALETVAAAIVHAVTRPEGANVETLDLRPL